MADGQGTLQEAMQMSGTRTSVLWSIAAAVVSGTISAVTLNPVMQAIERVGLGDIVDLLLPFALSAGLAFGICGAAVALWRLKLRAVAGGVFLAMSMVGMAAAVYVAVLTYDNRIGSFVLPYALASPVGALILAVPFAFVGGFAHPGRTVGVATVLPTLWAMGIGAVFTGDAGLEVPGLAALYIGWQGISLSIFAATRQEA